MERKISDKKKAEVLLVIEEINAWEESVRESKTENLDLKNVTDYLDRLSSFFDEYEKYIREILEIKYKSQNSLTSMSDRWKKQDYLQRGNDIWNGMMEVTQFCALLNDSESLIMCMKDYLKEAERVWPKPDEWKHQIFNKLQETIELEPITDDTQYLRFLKKLDVICGNQWHLSR